MGAGLGFGLDVFGALGGFFQNRRETAEYNAAVTRRNRLLINAYDTKNRNEENIWRNNKLDLDINTDQKYREAIDQIATSQLRAREVAGDAAIAQQKLMAQMFEASAGREQTGRRAGGRGKVAQIGAQMAAIGAKAAFAKDAAVLNSTQLSRMATDVAQGNYVKYITGRPSPAAPPILEEYKSQPSFLSTALQIGSAGLNRYMQWQDKKAPDTKNDGSWSLPPIDWQTPETEAPIQKLPYTPDSSGLNLRAIQKPEFLGGDVELGNELLSFVRDRRAANTLNTEIFNPYGVG